MSSYQHQLIIKWNILHNRIMRISNRSVTTVFCPLHLMRTGIECCACCLIHRPRTHGITVPSVFIRRFNRRLCPQFRGIVASLVPTTTGLLRILRFCYRPNAALYSVSRISPTCGQTRRSGCSHWCLHSS